MAISTDSAILNILKVYYRNSCSNLLFRNSPTLKSLKKTRVEGKQQNFAAIYGRGGAVAGNALIAKQKAAQNVRNAEFTVTPGQLFSMFSYNAKEVQASLSKRGAYMKVAGNKAFAATEAFRKTLAASLFGRGYGEIGILKDAYNFVSATPIDIKLPEDAVIKIDVGSSIVLKDSVESATELVTLEVNSIDDVTVNVTPSGAYSGTGGEVVCLAGSMDASGNGIIPVGLDAWLPIVNGRQGSEWTSYIGTAFNGVNRSINVEGLAGAFVAAESGEKKVDTIQKLIRKLRRHGSQANLIVMNDIDFLALSNEIASTNTYFTATSSKSKRAANIGFDSLSASFSTNFIDNIVDDPYCPKGKAYVLDTDTIEYFTYTNAETPVNDGVVENNPGKQDPMEADNDGRENDAYKLLVEDFITVTPGETTIDGDSTRVSLQFYGSLAVYRPSDNGVCIFSDADTDSLLGYK